MELLHFEDIFLLGFVGGFVLHGLPRIPLSLALAIEQARARSGHSAHGGHFVEPVEDEHVVVGGRGAQPLGGLRGLQKLLLQAHCRSAEFDRRTVWVALLAEPERETVAPGARLRGVTAGDPCRGSGGRVSPPRGCVGLVDSGMGVSRGWLFEHLVDFNGDIGLVAPTSSIYELVFIHPRIQYQARTHGSFTPVVVVVVAAWVIYI